MMGGHSIGIESRQEGKELRGDTKNKNRCIYIAWTYTLSIISSEMESLQWSP